MIDVPASNEEHAIENRNGDNVKLTLQRVLEARAHMGSKVEESPKPLQEDVVAKATINMAREVLAGYMKAGPVESSTADNGDGVQVWGASLIRSGVPKPLSAKGSLWRRDLGTVHDLHGLIDQPDIVRKVVGALNGLRSHASVISTMNGFVGQVTVSDLHQVLYVLGVMKEWLTALQVHLSP